MQNIDLEKSHFCTNNIKMENNKLKKVIIKNCTCYCFTDINKSEDFGFDMIFYWKKNKITIFFTFHTKQ